VVEGAAGRLGGGEAVAAGFFLVGVTRLRPPGRKKSTESVARVQYGVLVWGSILVSSREIFVGVGLYSLT
jgi:hypothetical protein